MHENTLKTFTELCRGDFDRDDAIQPSVTGFAHVARAFRANGNAVLRYTDGDGRGANGVKWAQFWAQSDFEHRNAHL